jgi:hypothetical protein
MQRGDGGDVRGGAQRPLPSHSMGPASMTGSGCSIRTVGRSCVAAREMVAGVCCLATSESYLERDPGRTAHPTTSSAYRRCVEGASLGLARGGLDGISAAGLRACRSVRTTSQSSTPGMRWPLRLGSRPGRPMRLVCRPVVDPRGSRVADLVDEAISGRRWLPRTTTGRPVRSACRAARLCGGSGECDAGGA